MEMPGGMLILRVVAAAHVAAMLADAQVHPGVAQGHALGTDVLSVALEVVQVEAARCVQGASIKTESKGWLTWAYRAPMAHAK